MYILQVYNRQRSGFGGEENVVTSIENMLQRRGHRAERYERSSFDIGSGLIAKMGAALSGIYNIRARKAFTQYLAADRPDIVHFHNIYPLFSPSVFDACRALHIPAVMSIHSHILTCPNWFHIRNDTLCEKCIGGHAYWCALTNCRDNIFESTAYAIRSMVADWFDLFRKPGLMLLPVSPFLGKRLSDMRCCPNQIVVVPNEISIPETSSDPGAGSYVAYAGRLRGEKGIDTLIEASRLTGLPVRIAGEGPLHETLEASAPPQVTFLGRLDSHELDRMYRGAKFLVVPSITYETFGLVAAEALVRGIPVIASDRGALSELVIDGATGLLFTPGDPVSLAEAMKQLWDDPQKLRRMGAAGRSLIQERYAEPIVYKILMEAYRRAGAQTENTDD